MDIKRLLATAVALTVAAAALLAATPQGGKASAESADHTVVLQPDTLWGIVRIPVASMRTAGKYRAELATQAVMGTPVRLLEEQGGWWHIQTPDGYQGWTAASAIARKTPQEMGQWRHSPRLVVTSLRQQTAWADSATTSPRRTVTDLVPGAIVEYTPGRTANGRVEVTLPDGRKAWADASALSTIEEWAAQDYDPDVILDQAYAMEGAPYLWGGTSAKSTDCSGLVKISYYANALILRRDASQQALTGEHLEPGDWRNYREGDLLFFCDKPGGRVTHVAIYDRDGWYVHCAGLVRRNSIDPASEAYIDRPCYGGSRIHGHEGSDGITRVRDHAWYF